MQRSPFTGLVCPLERSAAYQGLVSGLSLRLRSHTNHGLLCAAVVSHGQQGYCQEHPNKHTGSQSPESSNKGLWNTGRFSINPPNQREMCLRRPFGSGRSTNSYRIGHTARALAHFEKTVLCGANEVHLSEKTKLYL